MATPSNDTGNLVIDWREQGTQEFAIPRTCPCEIKLIEGLDLCEPVQYEHYDFSAEREKYYFYIHKTNIKIRLPKRLALWLSERCDNICVRFDGCRITNHYTSNGSA